MPEPAIIVNNLSKSYRLGVIGRQTLQDEVRYWWHKVRGRNPLEYMGKIGQPTTSIQHPASSNEDPNTFWALKDISFTVQPGEVLGIIGRNGAGKSTLLKILTRITEPTSGTAIINGRVASLLEVGTGFHPELTGRENIFLNGSILGMKKDEITIKFDEIVDFAEIHQFIDTPVKRYSSGMYVRLAFAVAAHLEPEILLVDEVLAVGDAAFQKKCLGKMRDVSKEGRTVLFVSHNMSMIESLCIRGILLEFGNLILDSTSEETIKVYLEKTYNLDKELPLEQRKDRSGSGKVRVSSFRILNEEGIEITSLQSGKDYSFEIGYTNYFGENLNNIIVSLDFFDEKNVRVLLLRSNFTNNNLSLKPEKGYITCSLKNLPLAEGLYNFSIFMSYADSEILDHIEDVTSVTVDGGDFFGTGSRGLPGHCKILIKADWSTQ